MGTLALSRTTLVGAWVVFLTLGASGVGPAILTPDRSREQSVTPIAVSVHQEKAASLSAEPKKPPGPSTVKSLAGTGRQGAALKVDAIFHDNGVLEWMLRNNWRAVLADENNRLTARVTAEGRLTDPTVITAGTPRDATSEIAGFIGGLPRGAVRGWLIWPDRVWAQIERKIRAREESAHAARLRYAMSPAGLAVTVIEIRSERGITRPAETFVVQL